MRQGFVATNHLTFQFFSQQQVSAAVREEVAPKPQSCIKALPSPQTHTQRTLFTASNGNVLSPPPEHLVDMFRCGCGLNRTESLVLESVQRITLLFLNSLKCIFAFLICLLTVWAVSGKSLEVRIDDEQEVGMSAEALAVTSLTFVTINQNQNRSVRFRKATFNWLLYGYGFSNWKAHTRLNNVSKTDKRYLSPTNKCKDANMG